MTGGMVAVLGPIGPNFGAGMTGGRAYLLDPTGRSAPALAGTSVVATRLSAAIRDRSDGVERVAELLRLVEAHAEAGSELAERLLLGGGPRTEDIWLVEPVATVMPQVIEAADVVPTMAPAAAATPIRVVPTNRPSSPVAVPTLS